MNERRKWSRYCRVQEKDEIPIGANRGNARRETRRIQVLAVIRETTTAKAIRTPHRHLSSTTCRHVAVQPRLPSPAPVVETARPFRGRTTPMVLGRATGAWVPSPALSVRVEGRHAADVTESEGSGDAVSGRPRSFSPMFGKGRRDGVQYCNR